MDGSFVLRNGATYFVCPFISDILLDVNMKEPLFRICGLKRKSNLSIKTIARNLH